MAEQRMVPVELLERILSITQPIAPAISAEIRSVIAGLDGWQLVPTEPTAEMLLAAWHEGWFSTQELRVHYKVMLAAAPQPPKESTAQSVACPADKEK